MVVKKEGRRGSTRREGKSDHHYSSASKKHEISVKRNNSKVATNEPIKDRYFLGSIDGIDELFCIFGWALDNRDLERKLKVTVYLDGKPVGKGVADQYREDLEREGFGNGRYGFRIELPRPLLESEGGKNKEFQLKVDDEVVAIRELVIPEIKTWIHGSLDAVDGIHVLGWAWDPNNPDKKLEIVIYVDGKPVAEGIADLHRYDLEKSGIGDGRYGFRIKLPYDVIKDTPVEITAGVKKKKVLLPNKILGKIYAEDYPYLYGIIDRVIFGWIISKEAYPRIDVLINDSKVGEIKDFVPAFHIYPNAYKFYYDLKIHHADEGDEVELISNGGKIKGPSIKLSNKSLFGLIEGFSGIECFGWAGTTFGDLPNFRIMVDDKVLEPDVTWYIRDDFRRYGIVVPIGFKFKVPEEFCDGNYHNFSLLDSHTNREISEKKVFRFKLKNFFIDIADSDTIAGWVQIEDYPSPVELDVYIENEKAGTVKADFVREDASKRYGSSCYGFYFHIPDSFKRKNLYEYTFSLWLANSRIKLIDSCKSVSLTTALEEIEKLAQTIREKGYKSLCSFLGESLDRIRKNFRNTILVSNAMSVADVVDVIVPVYGGREETLGCIESVLKAKTDVKFELIVIDDCSPDLELKKDLQELAKEGKIILIENNSNLGFVKSANYGMKLNPNRDVVVLNSDTLVPDFWLDRLRKAAYSSKNVATVTPLSNRATILSFPNPNEDNDLPYNLSYKQIDKICQKVNRGCYVDIPTAVGFCMYIKRECIEEVGFFDEDKFGKGYGEENDFCLRASAIGWKHIACLDLFVQHYGSLSFREEKPERVKKALQVINNLYPDYELRIKKFIDIDPIAPYRNKISKEILKEIVKRKYEKFVLFIIHNWGGGSLKYCLDIASLLEKEKIGSFFIFHKEGKIFFSIYESPSESSISLNLQFPRSIPLEKILAEIKDLPIALIHYNQTMNFENLDIWKIHEWLNVPYCVTIHDYFYVCPRVHLINRGGVFCGLPKPEICEECLSGAKLEEDIQLLYEEFLGSSIIRWREFYEDCLRRAKKVIFPSEASREYYQKEFALQNFTVKPHPEKFRAKINPYKREKRLKIAILGAIGEHKGYHQILRLIDYTKRNNLPFDFIFIGYTKDDDKLGEYENVKITGAYSKKELPHLIKIYKPTVALFLHVWPETYSYVLSEAIQHGLYPVTIDLGAPSERLRKMKVGRIIPYPASTEKIAKILLELYENGWEEEEVFVNNEYDIKNEYYEI